MSLEEVDAPIWRLCALASVDTDAGKLVAQAAESAALGVVPVLRAELLGDEDWVRLSQAQFSPLTVGKRLWIGPSWETPPAGMPAVVQLDPGLAFGTGSHPTTRLALRFLERGVRGGERVLDYGCGSGILAIAAAKLGASRVDAVDSDPEAVRTAAANAVALRVAAPEELPPALYDLVVSNILAQPLILLAPVLASRAAPGARIALSGILEAQATEVLQAYAPFLDAQVSHCEEGWALVEGALR